jgi:DNA-binding Xre family transcriptional regulator
VTVQPRLKEFMAERGITSLNEVARTSGVTYPTLLALYHGTGSGVTFEVLDKLCRAYKCKVGDILEHRKR